MVCVHCFCADVMERAKKMQKRMKVSFKGKEPSKCKKLETKGKESKKDEVILVSYT